MAETPNKTVPKTMTAIEIKQFGGPEQLVPATRPVPVPGSGEMLIKVAAAGVNRPDVLQRQGNYAPPSGASDLPGLEVAGVVAALGPDVSTWKGVSNWKVGDRATALLAGGGYAEYATAPIPQCLPAPRGLGMIEAAAIPETFFTVWTNVFERGQLKPGESFLVHGGSSGIGTVAIQLAKVWGARVFATASGNAKCKACEDLGAERCVDYRSEDFTKVIGELVGEKGVDVILDMIGGDYTAKNIQLLAMEGRSVQIATLRGAKVEINLAQVMMKRLTLTGSTLRSRSVEQKGAVAREVYRNVWPWLEEGKVKPVIYKAFTLKEAADAHRLMESSNHIGKIVLTV
ncbi:MAG TPA: NAD(P)H-quinone oxidoreductase [Alphaproteobacteria bacterium]|nr:NAD(P)H-quinone oxidoreductase [Alphaproteobacteria bacterium]